MYHVEGSEGTEYERHIPTSIRGQMALRQKVTATATPTEILSYQAHFSTVLSASTLMTQEGRFLLPLACMFKPGMWKTAMPGSVNLCYQQ